MTPGSSQARHRRRTSHTHRLRGLAGTGFIATLAAMVATTLAAALAQAVGVDFEVPDGGETIPLSGFAVVTGFFSVVGIVIAAALLRWSARPAERFVRTAVSLTAISLVPPLLSGANAATITALAGPEPDQRSSGRQARSRSGSAVCSHIDFISSKACSISCTMASPGALAVAPLDRLGDVGVQLEGLLVRVVRHEVVLVPAGEHLGDQILQPDEHLVAGGEQDPPVELDVEVRGSAPRRRPCRRPTSSPPARPGRSPRRGRSGSAASQAACGSTAVAQLGDRAQLGHPAGRGEPPADHLRVEDVPRARPAGSSPRPGGGSR